MVAPKHMMQGSHDVTSSSAGAPGRVRSSKQWRPRAPCASISATTSAWSALLPSRITLLTPTETSAPVSIRKTAAPNGPPPGSRSTFSPASRTASAILAWVRCRLPLAATTPGTQAGSATRTSSGRVTLLPGPRGAGLGYHVLELAHQPGHVIGDAVLDGPLHPAGVDGLAVLHHVHPGRVEHLEVLERVAVHDDQVGRVAGPDPPEPLFLPEDPGVVERRLLDHRDRVKPGLLVQLQLADQAESVHLVDEPRVVPHADQAAAPAEVA